jgi:hypothetical protein
LCHAATPGDPGDVNSIVAQIGEEARAQARDASTRNQS